MKTAIALLLALPLAACRFLPSASDSDDSSPTPSSPPDSDDTELPPMPPPRSESTPPSGMSSPPVPIRLDVLRTAADPPPPISGGSLAVSADGKRVVAADPDRDAVYIVSMDTQRVDKLELAAGSEPGRVALDGAGAVHVALRGSGKLLRIELATARVTLASEPCKHPRGLAWDAKHDALLASCMDGKLLTLDPGTHQERARAILPHDLRDVVVNAEGQRSVTRYRSAQLLSLQADDSVSTSVPPPATTNAGGLAGQLPTNILDLLGDAGVSVNTTVQVSPALAWRAVPSPSGHTWMLHQRSQNGEVKVASGGYGTGCQTITTGAVTEFDGAGKPLRSIATALQGLTVDLALSPDEKWLAASDIGGHVQVWQLS